MHSQLITRLALAAGFIAPVLVRLELIAPFIDQNNLESWSFFRDYQNIILQFFPYHLGHFSKITLSCIEVILAIGLLLGLHTKYMARCTTILTAFYAICLFFILGPGSLLPLPLIIFSIASAILANDESYQWSLDSLLTARKKIK